MRIPCVRKRPQRAIHPLRNTPNAPPASQATDRTRNRAHRPEGRLHRLRHGGPERFFRAYHSAHSQGGTNTKQRNLRHLFTWLASAYGHPHPYSSALVRYAPAQGRPSTLSGDFIHDLLTVTGAGKARDFWNARDHAMIRMLTEGVRRAELAQMRLADLPADLIATQYVRVVPLKGARAEDEGRIVPLTPETARAGRALPRRAARPAHRRRAPGPPRP
jgi:hypothetical protein